MAPSPLLKKRKREEAVFGKENAVLLGPAFEADATTKYASTACVLLALIVDISKLKRASLLSLKTPAKKHRRPTPSPPSLTTAPNTPAQVPSPSPNKSIIHTRCHVCSRARGFSLDITQCPLCRKGVCQVCRRQCAGCQEERCYHCCVEMYFSGDMADGRGDERDPVCLLCLSAMRTDDISRTSEQRSV
jgi:hypothetical protein